MSPDLLWPNNITIVIRAYNLLQSYLKQFQRYFNRIKLHHDCNIFIVVKIHYSFPTAQGILLVQAGHLALFHFEN